MILLVLLPILSICNESINLRNLTSTEFRDEVLKRDDTSIYFILFVGFNQKQCIKTLRQFQKASKQVGKLAQFAIVNISEEPIIQRRQDIQYVPLLRIYYPGGSETYNGKYTVSGFCEFVTSKLPNYVRMFDRKWQEENLPSVVLFTDQIKVPTIWAALSLDYKDKFLRFGICNEFRIHREFSISRLPTIIFYNSSNQIKYRGEMKEQDLRNAIDNFLNGTLHFDSSIDDEGFYKHSEFNDQCRGRDFCVLHTGQEINSEYRRIQQISKRHQLKFFYGNKDFPFPQLKENSYYIWNPRRNAVIQVNNIDDLSATIDRVIDGDVKWIKINELEKSQISKEL